MCVNIMKFVVNCNIFTVICVAERERAIYTVRHNYQIPLVFIV